MNWFERWQERFSGRLPAPMTPEAIETEIIARFGPRPDRFNPTGHHGHARLATDLRRSVEIEEWTDDLRQKEEEFARHTSPTVLLIGLVFAFLVEVLGGLLVMRSLDIRPSERLPLGVALAVALIGITAVTSGRTGRAPGESSNAARRPIATLLVLLVYSALVIAVAVVRLHGADEELSQTELFAESVVMLATCIGPAWFAEWLLRRRAPARLVSRELTLLRRRLDTASKAHGRAAGIAARLDDDGVAWDRAAGRLRAVLSSQQHQLRSAEESASSTRTRRRTS